MLYIMSRKIHSNGTAFVLDTDDLIVEEVPCEQIHAYLKVGGKVIYPFNDTDEECKYFTSGDWFVLYTMSHEPRTPGLRIKVGLRGKGVIYSTKVKIVWNAYPRLDANIGKDCILIQIDWMDKHYYREDREEYLTKFLGIDKTGKVILDRPADITNNCNWYAIDADGKIREN